MNALDRLRRNPFYVLELPVAATRADVERQGAKLIALLSLGQPGVDDYTTPFGAMKRSDTDVREAMAELREPQRRFAHELWVQLAGTTEFTPTVREKITWPARRALGWKRD